MSITGVLDACLGALESGGAPDRAEAPRLALRARPANMGA